MKRAPLTGVVVRVSEQWASSFHPCKLRPLGPNSCLCKCKYALTYIGVCFSARARVNCPWQIYINDICKHRPTQNIQHTHILLLANFPSVIVAIRWISNAHQRFPTSLACANTAHAYLALLPNRSNCCCVLIRNWLFSQLSTLTKLTTRETHEETIYTFTSCSTQFILQMCGFFLEIT